MATDELFQKLIELRLRKVYELSKWIGKRVTVRVDESSVPWGNSSLTMFAGAWVEFSESTVIDVNRFWVTFEGRNDQRRSYPVEKILLSFDHSHERLEVLVMFVGQSGI